MKLEVSIPDRVGWMPVIPVADIFALLLAFVVLSPAFLLEKGLPVELPVTDREMKRFTDPIVLSVSQGEGEPVMRLNREDVSLTDLTKRLEALLEAGRYSEGDVVVLRVDRNISVDLERSLIDSIQNMGLRCALAARPKE